MKKLTTSLIMLILAGACIVGAGTRNNKLIYMRQQYGLNAAEPLENAPPAMAFTTIVLGGFRGLIADILWIRASLLQDDGQYFEVVQLADWITKLEPRNNEIWNFHAWNMAYNISVMMPDYEDRWRWVNNGIQLLRDEGLLYNRGDPEVYHQLGWIFQDKIARERDMAHAVYKQKWAEAMTELLGGPTPDYAKLTDTQISRMRDEYKLEIPIMKELDKLYGPLDWTTPEPHAIYWAYLGIQRSNRKSIVSCKRMIRQTVRAIREGGYGDTLQQESTQDNE